MQRILREQGGRFVQSVWQGGATQPDRRAVIEADADPDDAGDEAEHEGEEDAPISGPKRRAHEEGEAANGDDEHREPRLDGGSDADGEASGPALSAEDLANLQKTPEGLLDANRMLNAALQGVRGLRGGVSKPIAATAFS